MNESHFIAEYETNVKGQNFRKYLNQVVQAERERCAKIAENYNNWHSGFYKIIADIAKNIRREK